MKKYLVLSVIFIVLVSFPQWGNAALMQLDLTMTPTLLGAPDVFGYNSVPSETYSASFYFDDIDDVDTSTSYVKIPKGLFTFQGDWGDAVGAGWDETMYWPSSYTNPLWFNVSQNKILSCLYFTNSLNNQIQFGYLTGRWFRMIDASVHSNNSLCGTTTLSLKYENPVPIPPAVWLLGSSCIALAGIRTKRKK